MIEKKARKESKIFKYVDIKLKWTEEKTAYPEKFAEILKQPKVKFGERKEQVWRKNFFQVYTQIVEWFFISKKVFF